MNYSLSFVFSLLGMACVAGFFGALLGVGGGIFVVPALALAFHLPIKIAVAASIVSVIATSNAGGSAYVEQHISNLRLAMFLEIFTTGGALVGAVLALFFNDWTISLIFSLLLAYLTYVSFSTRNLDDKRIAENTFTNVKQDRICAYLQLNGSYHDVAAGKDVAYVVTGAPAGMGIAALAGLASGLLGVGGGVLKVSALNRYMNVPMKVAVGTSKLMIGVTAAVGAILFFMAGLIHFMIVAPIAIGTTIGATIGTTVMNRLRSAVLKLIFSGLLAYLSYAMFAKALELAFAIHLPYAGR
ncbi:MAG TPA: sulfite exporter TauE/SafE family protein [Candidatus Dormibacteraeota bacterium]|nr:sulfite exporter TauE/SafE family protein [Candidatus Dormibacteraeota bacterium]